MTSPLLAAALAAPLAAAFIVAKAAPRAARAARVAAWIVAALASGAAWTGGSITIGDVVLFGTDPAARAILPVVAGCLLAAVLAVPANVASASMLSRLFASAGSLALLVACRHAGLTAVLVGLSTLPVWYEVRASGTAAGARVLLIHFGASTALMGAGLLLDGVIDTTWVRLLLLLGVLVRDGLVPFHGWIPVLYGQAPLGAAALFTAPRVGAIVLARFVLAGDPAGGPGFLSAIALATSLYGALLALVQPSARRTIGYLVVSQSALVLAALEHVSSLGVGGAVLLIGAGGLATMGFALALSSVEARRGPVTIGRGAGGYEETPGLAVAFLVLGLASAGLPGTIRFVAEDLVFGATLADRPLEGLAIVAATAINGITIMRAYFGIFGGARRPSGALDLTMRERVALFGLTAVLFVLGIVAPQAAIHLATADESATQLTSIGPAADDGD